MNTIRIWATLIVLLTSAAAFARQPLLDLHQSEGPDPQTVTRQFPFDVHEANTRLSINAKVALTKGRLGLRVLDSASKTVHDYGSGTGFTVQGNVLTLQPGTFQLEVRLDGAVGEWSVQVSPLPPLSAFRLSLVSGPAMILIALASVFYWRVRSKALWKWFWVGAAAWAVGVALKFAWAIALNAPILGAVEPYLPKAAYLLVGSLYIGLLTGVFEIGVTLLIGLIWRKLAADAGRAVAVGVGAGAIEALLLGLAALVSALLLVLGVAPDKLVEGQTQVALITPLFWLAPPVERVIAILCHASSRTLTLLTVATGRWSFFWWGFAILTAIDTVAGFFHLSGRLMTTSIWWIELTIAPAAVISVPIIRWCVRHWPVPTASPAMADSAIESTQGGPRS